MLNEAGEMDSHVAGGDGEMNTLKFHGYSDDTFGEYGVTGQDCDNCANEKPASALWFARCKAEHEQKERIDRK